MARMLYRLGTTAFRRWPLFIAGWLLFAVVLGSVAAAFSKPMSDEFTIPGIPSEQAADLQQELFPEAGTPSTTPPSTWSSPRPRATPSPSRRTQAQSPT